MSVSDCIHKFYPAQQGPNFSWHIDQYNKLATFGIFIHGCIDGYVFYKDFIDLFSYECFSFSRKIIWLHTETTNRDSKVILGYYLHALGQLGGK